MIGMIALADIAVRNSILFIEFVEERKEGRQSSGRISHRSKQEL
jgi:multidrug efflux pump subunit AcrB